MKNGWWIAGKVDGEEEVDKSEYGGDGKIIKMGQ